MTLRQKILLLGLVAVSGMLLALWLQYRSFTTQSLAIEAVARNAKTVGALSRATHQLQKERGLSAIGHSNGNGQALAEQLRHTDTALARLAATGFGAASLGGPFAQLRLGVAAGTLAPLSVVDSYSTLLQRLVDEMDRLTSDPAAAGAKTGFPAHTHLVAAKEYLGQIRGTLGYWIGHQRDDPNILDRLIRLKSLHEEELRKFRLAASPELRETFAVKFTGQDVEQTQKTVTRIATTGKLPQELDMQSWWPVATAAIDRLNFVEDYSLESIEQKAEDELAQLRNAMRLGTITMLALGLVVLILTVTATATLLRTLNRALASIELIAASQDFHSRIPADTSDEIGRISRSFNQLLEIAERLLKEKDCLANTDPLTGINNRMRFGKVLGEEAERKRRNKMPMALIMFDIDHFKRVNDAYGHNVGDEVLITLAHFVSGEVRVTDFFCRWGGEEFVLLLRDDDCEAAMVAAEKLRNLIASVAFPIVGKLTCSFGVTGWEQHDTEVSLVARADQALYAAKDAGRNRVVCARQTLTSTVP